MKTTSTKYQQHTKIIILGKHLPGTAGGIEKFVGEVSSGLSELEYSVEVVGLEKSFSKKSYSVANDNGDFEWFKTNSKVAFQRLKKIGQVFSQPIFFPNLKKLRASISRSDLVILNHPNPLMDFYYLLCGGLNKSTIVVFHSEILGKRIIKQILSPIFNLVLSRSKLIVVSSPQNKSFASLKKYQEKVFVCPFGIDASQKPTSDKKSVDEEFALFTGRLVNYKGVEYLIRAMEKVNMPLFIVGDGPKKTELQKLSRKLKQNSKIVFLGEVSDSQLNEILSRCSFLVLPSIMPNETFGFSLLEAMAKGKPVISTRLGTGVEFVNRDGHTGLNVDPKNSDQLSSAINLLKNDLKMRTFLGFNAKSRVRLVFDAAKMCERLSRVIDALVLENRISRRKHRIAIPFIKNRDVSNNEFNEFNESI